MIAIKRGKVKLFGAANVGGMLTITLSLNTPAAGITAAIPQLKYNKAKWICFEMDDASKTLYNAWNSKLKLTTYTDGCGNNIPFGCGVAVNGRDQSSNEEVGNIATALTYAERLEMLPFGLDVMNHSMYHDPNGTYNNGNNAALNVQQLDELIYQRMAYKMNCLVVPTNYAGYMDAAANIGYVGGDSTGTFDSKDPYPAYTTFGDVSAIPDNTYQAIRRDFTDNWTNTGSQWSLNNELFNNGKTLYSIGTHGLWNQSDITNFNAWIDDIKTRGGDNAIFSSLREMLEYRYLRSKLIKTEHANGNMLTISVDYSNVVNSRISWLDTTFLLSSGTIQSAICDNQSYSISFNNNLVNIKKRKTTW